MCCTGLVDQVIKSAGKKQFGSVEEDEALDMK